MLRAPDRAAVHRLDVDQAGLAHALEVQAHGVGVEAEPLGELRRDERAVEPGELAYMRVAGLVAERLEHREGGFMLRLTVPAAGHIFKVEACFIQAR